MARSGPAVRIKELTTPNCLVFSYPMEMTKQSSPWLWGEGGLLLTLIGWRIAVARLGLERLIGAARHHALFPVVRAAGRAAVIRVPEGGHGLAVRPLLLPEFHDPIPYLLHIL